MQEIQSAFDVLHKNFDFRINNAIRDQSRNLQILNAQLISRLGFVNDEIRAVEQLTRDAIEQRGLNITNPEADCIVDARGEIDNAVEYAGSSINGVVGEVMWNINDIEHRYFYPLIQILQLESNIIQWSVKSGLRRYNPVSQADRLIQRLDDDYGVMVILYQASIANIASEITGIDEHMNTVKQSYFPQLNGVRDYFIFTANFIRGTLEQCQ